MVSMSYCMWNNTYREMAQVNSSLDESDDEDMSDEERFYRTAVLKLCQEMAQKGIDKGLIEKDQN